MFVSWTEHIAHVFSYVKLNGLFCEFGVWMGGSLTHFVATTPHFFHGFDSFRGLPGRWQSYEAGYLDLGGKPPKGEKLTPDRVEFHIGLFADTITPFLDGSDRALAFGHIDCDLYESAATVLALARDRIIPGTVLVFDEYITGDGHDERAAFLKTGIPFRYLSHHILGGSVAVIIG